MNNNLNRIKAIASFIAMMFLPVCPIMAKDHYIDPKTWKKMAHNDFIHLQAGDRLFLKRGGTYYGVLKVIGQGTKDKRILIDAYGHGTKPCLSAPADSSYTVLVSNSNYLSIQNLNLTNQGQNRLAGRTGIKVSCIDYGVSHGITLRSLTIHDIKGSLIKHSGEGSGILLENKWKLTPSAFDSLLIENCIVRKCERNGIIWAANSNRNKWFPNRHVVVRKCLIEQVPGDGIVPIGCDGALIEYNMMRDSPDILPEKEAAAGFWPWSCDNTIIQYNEVSGHKAHWDGQAFDSDFNCKNTMIRYNYSHDNYGGFLLVCSPKIDQSNIGNIGTIVEYNLSVNDGIRPYLVYTGEDFSPIIHISGPCYNTRINHNILYNDDLAEKDKDHRFIYSGKWDAYAECTYILDNAFYVNAKTAEIELTNSRKNYLSGNRILPLESFPILQLPLKKEEIADGVASVEYVDSNDIKMFFNLK